MKETMTVHQALCELKTLSKRVTKAIMESNPIATKEHAAQKVSAMEIEEFKRLAISQHASALDLLRRQVAIKAAINQYNASKIVTVAGKDYSIAQAIWMMNFGVDEQKRLLNHYAELLANTERQIERANGQELNKRAEAAMNSLYGSKDKANADEYMAGLESYKKAHALEVIDPIKIRDFIQKLSDDIAAFESGVDAAIQIANATTTIEFEY